MNNDSTQRSTRSSFPYKLNHVYHFTLKNYRFDNISKKELDLMFKRGDNVSPFLERYFAKKFNLEFVNERHFDFLDPLGNRIEQKTFTKHGCCFLPSTRRNSGFEYDCEFMDVAQNNVYLICDVTTFPKIQVIFKKGYQLFQQFPKGYIYKKSDLF